MMTFGHFFAAYVQQVYLAELMLHVLMKSLHLLTPSEIASVRLIVIASFVSNANKTIFSTSPVFHNFASL
jgi:hypothetical protein